MTPLNWTLLAATILSLLIALVDRILKIRWSREFAEAKQAELHAKDATIANLGQQVAFLMEQTPERMLQQHRAITEYYEGLLQKASVEHERLKAGSNEAARVTEQITLLQSELERHKNLVATYQQQLTARVATERAVISLALATDTPVLYEATLRQSTERWSSAVELVASGPIEKTRAFQGELVAHGFGVNAVVCDQHQLHLTVFVPLGDDPSSAPQSRIEQLARGLEVQITDMRPRSVIAGDASIDDNSTLSPSTIVIDILAARLQLTAFQRALLPLCEPRGVRRNGNVLSIIPKTSTSIRDIHALAKQQGVRIVRMVSFYDELA